MTETSHIFGTGRSAENLALFKFGTPMEYHPHHRHARWPPSWKLWVAVEVTICGGPGHIVPVPLQAARCSVGARRLSRRRLDG